MTRFEKMALFLICIGSAYNLGFFLCEELKSQLPPAPQKQEIRQEKPKRPTIQWPVQKEIWI